MSEKERVVYLFGELIEFCECGDSNIWAELITSALYGQGAESASAKWSKATTDPKGRFDPTSMSSYKP